MRAVLQALGAAQGAADCIENPLTVFAVFISGFRFPTTPITEQHVSQVDITCIPLFVRKFLRPYMFLTTAELGSLWLRLIPARWP